MNAIADKHAAPALSPEVDADCRQAVIWSLMASKAWTQAYAESYVDSWLDGRAAAPALVPLRMRDLLAQAAALAVMQSREGNYVGAWVVADAVIAQEPETAEHGQRIGSLRDQVIAQTKLVEVNDVGLVPMPIRPFTPAQRRRLWDNSKEHHKDAASFTGFERIVTLTERAHGINGLTVGGDGEKA